MEELFFQYGRYLLISSSRDCPDALPANLQGVWNAVDNPPWNSDYHLNINLQMNYWPAYVTNLLETTFPVINYIDDLRVVWSSSGCKVCRNRLSGRRGEWLVGSYSSDSLWLDGTWLGLLLGLVTSCQCMDDANGFMKPIHFIGI